jgi:hypothetical protein
MRYRHQNDLTFAKKQNILKITLGLYILSLFMIPIMNDFKIKLEEAKTIADIFEVVKAVVLKAMKKSRGGFMLGIADLGNNPKGFFGGFFTTGSNLIIS